MLAQYHSLVCTHNVCCCCCCGCLRLQILPFCSEETLTTLEGNLAKLPSVTQMLNDGLTADDITDRILAGLVGELPPDRITLEPRSVRNSTKKHSACFALP